MAGRFSADLLSVGVFVTAESTPEGELFAFRGIIEAETSDGNGERAWVVVRTDDGRRRAKRVLRDNEIHTCTMDGCPRCPHLERHEVRRLLSDLFRTEAGVGRHRTEADRANANRIRGLVQSMRRALMR